MDRVGVAVDGWIEAHRARAGVRGTCRDRELRQVDGAGEDREAEFEVVGVFAVPVRGVDRPSSRNPGQARTADEVLGLDGVFEARGAVGRGLVAGRAGEVLDDEGIGGGEVSRAGTKADGEGEEKAFHGRAGAFGFAVAVR